MNHLEQLVSEWLQYRGYFVRTSVQVGPRPNGGFEGELDVIGVHLGQQRLIHVECSVDTLSMAKREERFAMKFERGRRFIEKVFDGLTLPTTLEQVAVLQFPNTSVQTFGTARIISVRDLVHEIYAGLAHTTPASGAVPVTLPLLRTLQLAADANRGPPRHARLIVDLPPSA